MAEYVLIDASGNSPSLDVQGLGTAPGRGGCIAWKTLTGGRSDGVQVLGLSSGPFAIQILPQRGMGLWKGDASGARLGWDSPIHGPVHPAWVPVAQPDGLGWLWGFDEWLARCGLESNGPPEFNAEGRLLRPLHGRIANLPAHRLSAGFDETNDELWVTGEVMEARLHFSKLLLRTTYRMKIGSSSLQIVDEIINRSATPAEAQMLYHLNFGPPLCSPGSRVHAAVETIVARTSHAAANLNEWDTFGEARPGFEEQVYFFKLHADSDARTVVVLVEPQGDFAASVSWNTQQLPCFTLWKNTVTYEDGYVAGIEPATNFPNPRSYESEQGRTVRLDAGAVHRMEWTIEMHHGAEAVRSIVQKVDDIRNGRPMEMQSTKPGWIPNTGSSP